MRCPKCGCEVGNQAICPFCGATIYMSRTTMPVDYTSRATIPVQPQQRPAYRSDTDKRLRSLETRVNMMLVLQGGTFAMLLLVLISMLLK